MHIRHQLKSASRISSFIKKIPSITELTWLPNTVIYQLDQILATTFDCLYPKGCNGEKSIRWPHCTENILHTGRLVIITPKLMELHIQQSNSQRYYFHNIIYDMYKRLQSTNRITGTSFYRIRSARFECRRKIFSLQKNHIGQKRAISPKSESTSLARGLEYSTY
jgi:hypothetical protein